MIGIKYQSLSKNPEEAKRSQSNVCEKPEKQSNISQLLIFIKTKKHKYLNLEKTKISKENKNQYPMPMPLKAMMARKIKRKPISNVYAVKSDDDKKDQKKPIPKPMPLKAMMAKMKRPLKPD